jgi:hypothetical protein
MNERQPRTTPHHIQAPGQKAGRTMCHKNRLGEPLYPALPAAYPDTRVCIWCMMAASRAASRAEGDPTPPYESDLCSCDEARALRDALKKVELERDQLTTYTRELEAERDTLQDAIGSAQKEAERATEELAEQVSVRIVAQLESWLEELAADNEDAPDAVQRAMETGMAALRSAATQLKAAT